MFINNVITGLNHLTEQDVENGNFLDDYARCYLNDDNDHIYYGLLTDYNGDEVLLDLDDQTFYLSNIDADEMEQYIKMNNRMVNKFSNPEFKDLADLRERLKLAYEEYDYDNLIDHVSNKDIIQ